MVNSLTSNKLPERNNIAFIDGQNLHMGTLHVGWKIDHKKFRVYLRDKYHVSKAYYFLGYMTTGHESLYKNLEEAGFSVRFKIHDENVVSNKKGNVDGDIIFEVMRNVVDNKDLSKIVLVSGDGDYIKLVMYLLEKGLLLKILFPNRQFASSLYNRLGSEYFDYLSNTKSHIEYSKS